MRVDAVTVGSWAGFAIIGVLIGLFIPHHCQCPPDGNPVSYHLAGKATLKDSGFKTACNANSGCVLTFDIRTSESGAVANTAACGSSSCFHFNDYGTKADRWHLDMMDAATHPTYLDYVDGTVTYEPAPVKP